MTLNIKHVVSFSSEDPVSYIIAISKMCILNSRSLFRNLFKMVSKNFRNPLLIADQYTFFFLNSTCLH